MRNISSMNLIVKGSEKQITKLLEYFENDYGYMIDEYLYDEDGGNISARIDCERNESKEICKKITNSLKDKTGLYIRAVIDIPEEEYIGQFIYKNNYWNFENSTDYSIENSLLPIQELYQFRKGCNTINSSRTFENIVTSFFFYMWNTWGTEEEIKIVFPQEHLHFTAKWQTYFEVYGMRASENFYSQLSPDNRERLVNRACDLYNGRTKVK